MNSGLSGNFSVSAFSPGEDSSYMANADKVRDLTKLRKTSFGYSELTVAALLALHFRFKFVRWMRYESRGSRPSGPS